MKLLSLTFISILISVLINIDAQAATHSKWEFALSATSLPVSAVTSTTDAKKGFLGEIYSPIGFKYNFLPFSARLMTSKISLISNKDKDKGLTTSLTQIEGDYYFNSNSSARWKSQLGVLLYEMKGSGGQTQLNNGTSVSTFDLPSRTTNSQLAYTGVGSEFEAGPINIEFDLNFLSLFSNSRRSYFMSLTFGVPL